MIGGSAGSDHAG